MEVVAETKSRPASAAALLNEAYEAWRLNPNRRTAEMLALVFMGFVDNVVAARGVRDHKRVSAELVGEAYVKLLKYISSFDPARDVKFSTWCKHLVTSVLFDSWRRERRYGRLVLPIVVDFDTGETLDEAMDRIALSGRRVRHAVLELQQSDLSSLGLSSPEAALAWTAWTRLAAGDSLSDVSRALGEDYHRLRRLLDRARKLIEADCHRDA